MKRILILLILFLSSTAFAGNVCMMGGGGTTTVAGPACTTGADSFTSVATDDSATSLSTSVRGSSFTATENMNLYSIKVTVTSTGDGAMTCRYGTGADLATYRVTKTVNTSNGTADVEIPFADTANTLGSGTTYYFGCIVDSGNINFKRNASGGYAGGVLTYSTGGWNMNDPVTGYDVKFTVRKCTN
jgi:hypothetical protein